MVPQNELQCYGKTVYDSNYLSQNTIKILIKHNYSVYVKVSKDPSKQGHIVADALLPMTFLGLRKLGKIFCGHKMFLNKIRNIFLCPGHEICVHNKCCARGQTGKHLCRQQCVRNNVSSFARDLRVKFIGSKTLNGLIKHFTVAQT